MEKDMPNWTAFLKQQLGAKYIEPGQQNPGRKAINKSHEAVKRRYEESKQNENNVQFVPDGIREEADRSADSNNSN